jgi:hypothetical protein
LERLLEELGDDFLQPAVVLNSGTAFLGLLAADRSGRALAVDNARPTIIETMAAGWIAMAWALRFATGAPRSG